MAERDATAARGSRPRAVVRRPAGPVVQGEVVEPPEESHPNGAAKVAPDEAGAGAAGDEEAALAGDAHPTADETPQASADATPQASADEPPESAEGESPEAAEGDAPDAAEDAAGDTAAPAQPADTTEQADTTQQADATQQADTAEPQTEPQADTAEQARQSEPRSEPRTDGGEPASDVVPATTTGLPPAFPTEESLAQQGEATTQLRRAIDELRQMLDVDAVPPMPAPTPRRRRRPALLAAAVALVVVLVAVVVALRGSGDDEPATARPAPSPSAPAASASAPAVDLPTPFPPAPGTAPLSGPGVDEPGTLLVVRLEGDALQVTEQAILSEAATTQIPLMFSDVRRLGGEIAGLSPQVTELRASLDRRAAPVRAAGDGRWFIPLSGSPTRVAVSYKVTGAILPTQPSESGRALVLVQPLLGRGLAPEQLPLVVRTTGMKGLGAACPDAPAALSLCGQGDGKGNWTATVPQSLNPTVVVQVDLPTGGAAP